MHAQKLSMLHESPRRPCSPNDPAVLSELAMNVTVYYHPLLLTDQAPIHTVIWASHALHKLGYLQPELEHITDMRTLEITTCRKCTCNTVISTTLLIYTMFTVCNHDNETMSMQEATKGTKKACSINTACMSLLVSARQQLQHFTCQFLQGCCLCLLNMLMTGKGTIFHAVTSTHPTACTCHFLCPNWTSAL